MAEVNQRLDALRALMAKADLAGYVVPSSDPHMSEYVPARFRGRTYMTGFTGSAGTLSLLAEGGTLYVDGRYILQAAEQVEGTGLEVSLIGAGKPEPWDVFCRKLPRGSRVGCYAATLSVNEQRRWKQALAACGIELVPGEDLLDQVWEDRPAWPKTPIWIHELTYAGRTTAQKLAEVRKALEEKGADTLIVSSLDDIAWLTNLRGGDVTDVPVFCAWVLVTPEKATLFIHPDRLEADALALLAENGMDVADYDALPGAVAALPQGARVAYDPACVNTLAASAIPEGCTLCEMPNVTTYIKACKDAVELDNMRKANLYDGLAMAQFSKWLPEAMAQGEVTELDVCDKLIELRTALPDCVGVSFSTICAYGPHGAQMHYSPYNGGNCVLEPHGLMVLDSGAQFRTGTTDITRTVILGELTEQERWDYTMAWKCHVALAEARFPYGTTGTQLDALARANVWRYGLDYRCGTGHGVGLCLSVHEGPVGFRSSHNPIPVAEGMVLTIEPGIYRAEMHGVRHENMVLVRHWQDTEYGRYLEFEPITLCPIDKRGMDLALLDDHELDYLNHYHALVYEKLAPLADDALRAWLEEACAPLTR